MLDDADDSRGVKLVLGEVIELVDAFVDAIATLRQANEDHPADDVEPIEHAKYVQTTVIPAMDAVREVADKLERAVPDRLWPLPKYSEMLFVK